MPSHGADIGREILLSLIDRSYEKQSWHGPNLKGAIRGLSATTVTRRPSAGRHSIAEIVVHTAYWKYAVRRRLLNEPRGSFALPGSNWFSISKPLDESDWRSMRKLLDNEHMLLRDAISAFPASRWRERAKGGTGKYSYLDTVVGIAQHDVYHAGQIQLLKRLCSGP